MTNVTDLKEYKQKDDPHVSGPAKCLSCGHEWEVVVPVGVSEFECPSCGLMRGTHQYQISPDDGIVWQCACGNNLFIISSIKNAICIGCGQHQRFEE